MQESEFLRDFSHQIEKMKHPFSAEHKAILQAPLIQFVEKPDPSSVTNVSSTMNYTLTVAITQYVAKATELKSFSTTEIKNKFAGQPEKVMNAFDRLMNFMIDNGKGSLTYYADKAKELFFKEFESEISSKSKVIIIALIIDPIVIIILMVLFIPFILKVQSNLLKIYLHLCQFKDSDIRNWLEICNNSSSDIKSSITRIRKIYGATIFEVNLTKEGQQENQEAEKQVKVKGTDTVTSQGKDEERKVQNATLNTTQKQTEAQLLKPETETENNEEIMKSKEDVLSERKQKMFSQMTKEKTKAYLFYLLFFAFYIGIFRTADGLVFSSLYSETDLRVYLYRMLSKREHNDIRSIFFLREELLQAKPVQYFDGTLSGKINGNS